MLVSDGVGGEEVLALGDACHLDQPDCGGPADQVGTGPAEMAEVQVEPVVLELFEDVLGPEADAERRGAPPVSLGAAEGWREGAARFPEAVRAVVLDGPVAGDPPALRVFLADPSPLAGRCCASTRWSSSSSLRLSACCQVLRRAPQGLARRELTAVLRPVLHWAGCRPLSRRRGTRPWRGCHGVHVAFCTRRGIGRKAAP